MPHYIIQLEDEDQFAVYSTIVDNLITDAMPAKAMNRWLEDQGYSYWLEKTVADDDQFLYWHDEGFAFAKLSDAYFCLPMEYWRD